MLHVYLFCIALSAGWALVRTGLEDGPARPRGARPPPSITVPAAAFGLAGLSTLGLGASQPLHLGFAITAGLLSALASGPMRRARMTPDEHRLARVTVGIPAGGVGEIVWILGPERGTSLARAIDGEPLPRGTEVRVVAIDAGGVLVGRIAGRLIPIRQERASGG